MSVLFVSLCLIPDESRKRDVEISNKKPNIILVLIKTAKKQQKPRKLGEKKSQGGT